MWWRAPRAGPDDLDPRLGPFRERGGRLFGDDGALAAEIYLQPEVWWTGGGWLRWRNRPEPVEVVNAYVIDARGRITDEYTYPSEALDEAVARWSTGTIELDEDDVLRVVWLDDDESAALRDRAGLDVADLSERPAHRLEDAPDDVAGAVQHSIVDRSSQEPPGRAVQVDGPAWPSAPDLQTLRLLLEPLRVEHADEAALAFADPALHRHTGGHPAGPDELRARYTRQVVGHSPDGQHGWLTWMLRDRRTTQLVGTVQATTSQAPDGTRSAEIAWVVATSHQGQRLASEAGAAVASWLLRQGFTALVAHVRPDDVASAVTAYRLGMTPTPALLDGQVVWASRFHHPAR